MKKNYFTNCPDPFAGLTMKLQRKVALLLFVIFGFLNAQSQVTVAGANSGNGNYTTLGAAFTAIGTLQTGANITVAITANTTESSAAILGAGDWTSLIITPSGGSWSISGSLASELILLNGADNVTINGLNTGGNGLTISNASTSNVTNTSTIRFLNDATNNTITNCTVLGSGTASTTLDGGVIWFSTGNATGTGNDNNTISNCNVGPAGTNLPTKLIFGKGNVTDAAVGNSGISITNCNLYDYYLAGGCAAIYASSGSLDWTVSNNKIYQTATRNMTSYMYGIACAYTAFGGNFQITGNTIGYADNAGTGNLTITGTGSFQGIYLMTWPSAPNASNITGNTIANISFTSGSGLFNAINNSTSVGSNAINISGNTIKNIASLGGTGEVTAIVAGAAGTLTCNNNTINTISRAAAGTFYGISYAAPANVTINSNSITALSATFATGANAFSGIHGIGAALIETITNNTIIGLTSSSTSAQTVIGITVGTGNANKTIQNNILNNFTVPGSATGTVHGIKMSNAGALNVISGNTVGAFSGPNSSGGTNGMFLNPTGTTVNNIYNNKVYGLTGTGAASCVFGIMIQAGTTYTIYNNFIGDLTAPNTTSAATQPHQIIAINTWGSAMNLYNNTIVLNGTNNGTGFGSSVLSTDGPLTMRNNIMINTLPASGVQGVSTILRFASGVLNYNAASNNNLFKGTTIYTTNGTVVDNTLDAFKARVAPRDLLSVSETPTFASTLGSDANYLHINTTVPTQIESGGAPIALVANDFDGDVRNASTPDIGADEFTGVLLDLLGPVITHTPSTTCTTGSRTISATISDATGVPTTGTGLPVVYWRINNGAYTAVVGTSMGSSVYDFTIGTGTVIGDVVNYYFVAQDNVATANLSVYPSLGATGFTSNPPAVATPPTTPIAVYTPMGGVYTVGTAGNYTTLTAAVADYNSRCLTGPVTFSLLDPAYASETYPITIKQNADASAINTLTIKPAAGVVATISGDNPSGLLKLNGADYVFINGLNTGGSGLTISNTSTVATAGISTIEFNSDATNNTITNCSLLGSGTVPVATAGGVVYFGAGTATGNDNNIISNCNIGPVGSNLPTKLIYGSGLNTNEITCNSEITITSCNLYDFFIANNTSAAIYAALGNTAWNITGNKIYQTGTRTFTGSGIMYGIYFSNSVNGNNVQITGNTIGYADNTGTGTLTIAGNFPGGFQGIYNITSSTAGTACNINNNTIANISLTSTTGALYGINNVTLASNNTININGNTIKDLSALTTTGSVFGVYTGAATTLNCNSNIINNISRTGAGILYGINYVNATTATFDANTITNLSSTNAGSTQPLYGIFSSVAVPTEVFTNNTLSGFTSSSTAAQNIYGISNGSSATGNKTFRGNVLSNFTLPSATGTATINGIRMASGGALNEISGNTIHTLSGGTTVHGISILAGTSTSVFKNKIYGLSSSVASPVVYGVGISGGTTYDIYNNIVGDLTAPAANANNPVVGMNISGPTTVNAYNNTVRLNASSPGPNFGSTAFSVAGPPNLTLQNNIFVNTSIAMGAGYSVAFRKPSPSITTSYTAASNNNLFYGTAIFSDNTTADVTLSAFQTRVAPRDALSVNENPSFVSTLGSDANYLHINAAVPTQIESGGTNVASVTVDFDGDLRNVTTPDIGADEFTGTGLTVVAINSLGITPSTNQCIAAGRTVTANVTAGANNITSVVLNYSFNGVAQTPITMTGGTLTAGTTSDFTATIPVAVPVNANVTWNVVATDPVTAKTTLGTSYKDVPMLGLTASVSASLNTVCQGGTSVLSATIVPQATPFATSFESGLTDFTAGAVTGTADLTQSTLYASGTASMRFRTLNNSADVNVSSAANVDLSTLPQAFLTFSHIAALDGPSTAADFGYVQYSSDGGTTWIDFPVSSYLGTGTLFNSAVCFSTKSYANWTAAITATGSVPTNALWQNETIAVPTSALTSQFKIRFRHTTSASNLYYGWLIDNVKIVSGLPAAATAYSWSDGSTVVGTTNNLSVSPTTTTTYTATITSSGCTVTSSPVTITVTPNVPTTFTQIAPICSGGTFVLPTTSIEGVVGTWAPPVNNTATTLYTFTANAGQCGTATMTVVVTPNTTTFTQIPAICSGGTFVLPTTSIEGVVGTWAPPVNNTATTLYTFTPNAGQCGTTATMTVTVTPNVTTTFTQIPAICAGATLVLPAASIEGIAGTWAPPVNNTATTLYTFTPNVGQCGTTATMTVTVTPNVTTTFTQVPAICAGATFVLPTTSNEGIVGTWLPAVNNTTTTLYTFTPNVGQCGTTATMTVTVTPNVTTTFTQVPAICAGGTFVLPAASIEGIAGTWAPPVNNTATTLYTFTPNVGQCGTTATMTVTVTPNVTTTFTQVPAICAGGTFVLPTTSNQGIVGTWLPAVNNTTTTLYTFTPNAGQCGTTATMTVTVTPNVTTTFTQVSAICSGATLVLPTTSNEGIVGTWLPAVNNMATTLYTFTPNAGQCGTTATMTIVVNSVPAPTGPASQTFTQGQTLANITVTGTGIVWYASAANASAGINPLPNSTLLVNNTTYYATQSVSGCVSPTSLAVLATVTLGVDGFALTNLKVYPNPVSDVLQIENSESIANVEVFNIAGQKVISKNVNAMTATIPMSGFAAGAYFVKVSTENAVKTLKVIKK